MKTQMILTMVICGALGATVPSRSLAFPGMAKGGETEGKKPAGEHGEQPEGADIAVTVNGMVCSFCAQGITKKFKEMPQIAAVDIRMAESRVYLTLKKGEELDDQKIKDALSYSGYDVEKILRPVRGGYTMPGS